MTNKNKYYIKRTLTTRNRIWMMLEHLVVLLLIILILVTTFRYLPTTVNIFLSIAFRSDHCLPCDQKLTTVFLSLVQDALQHIPTYSFAKT